MSEQFDEQGNLITTPQNSNEVDRERQYKALQAGLTKTAQENAELRRRLESNTWSQQEVTDIDQLDELLRSRGYVKQDDVYNLKTEMASEQKLNELLSYNPDLNKFADAIKTLSKSENIAYEDVIQKYWFWNIDKLQKAKERNLMWDRTLETQPKSVRELSDAEWKEFQKANANGWTFSKVDAL